MYGRAGLDRFRKAQSLEPFSVSAISSATTTQLDHNKATYQSVAHSQCHALYQQNQNQQQHLISQKPVGSDAVPEVVPPPHVTQIGGGQSTWQPPDWAIEPRTGVYFLEVLKDGEILDRINLDKRRNLFGRQHHACDFVLDHQSVSRQHAAVIPHKNGSIYVIDLGSAHGTFVANERLGKDSPVELEEGQSIRFAASTRTYILRKNDAALFPPPVPPEIDLPPPPDPCDEEAVLSYNTILNRYGLSKSNLLGRTCRPGATTVEGDDIRRSERASKRIRRLRVAFRDQVGGELVEVVGVSDGADVETEPGPLGVKEGSLVGKYESLVQITVIPKGKDQDIIKEDNCSPKGVTSKLQEILNRVKSTPKTGIYDDLYGEAFSGKVGTSWAYASSTSAGVIDSLANVEGKALGSSGGKPHNDWSLEDDDDDLFGD